MILVRIGVLAMSAMLVVGACTAKGPTSPDAAESTDGATTSSPTTTAPFYTERACLTWDSTAPEVVAPLPVECRLDHLLEVSGKVDLTGDYGPDAARPDQPTLDALINDRCAPTVTSYLDHPLGADSPFHASGFLPTTERWADGDRMLTCGVVRGDLTPMKERVSDLAWDSVYRVGQCLTGDESSLDGGTIDCHQPHVFEVTGTVDAGTRFSTKPTQLELNTYLDEACKKLMVQYLGRSSPDRSLENLWIPIDDQSWDAGVRQTSCGVGRLDDQGHQVQQSSPAQP